MGEAICSFCGRPASECATVVKGTTGCICDQCVLICLRIITDKALDRWAGPQPLPASPVARGDEVQNG